MVSRFGTKFGYRPNAHPLSKRLKDAAATYGLLGKQVGYGVETQVVDNNGREWNWKEIANGTLAGFTEVIESPNWSSTTDGWNNYSGGASTTVEVSYTDSHGVTKTNVLANLGGETSNLSPNIAGQKKEGFQYRIQGWVCSDVAGEFRSQGSDWGESTTVEADTWTAIDLLIVPSSSGSFNFRFQQDSTAESEVRLSEFTIEEYPTLTAAELADQTPLHNPKIPWNSRVWDGWDSTERAAFTNDIILTDNFFIEVTLMSTDFDRPGCFGRVKRSDPFNSGFAGSFMFRIESSGTVLNFRNAGITSEYYPFNLDSPLEVNVPYKLRFEVTSGTVRLYVDGFLQTQTFTMTGGHFDIGALNYGFYGGFSGILADININNEVILNNSTLKDTVGSNHILLLNDTYPAYYYNHATQSTESAQPKLVTDGNGNVSLGFDGVDDELTFTTISDTDAGVFFNANGALAFLGRDISTKTGITEVLTGVGSDTVTGVILRDDTTDNVALTRTIQKLTGAKFGVDDGLTQLSNAFNSLGITEIDPNLLLHATQVTTVSSCFYNNAITAIPAGLFDSCPLVTIFSVCFQDNAITAIPAGLFDSCTLATRFAGCFRDNAITAIPAGLFDSCPLVTSFFYCFYNNAITTIPAGLFDNCTLATNYTNCFANNALTQQSVDNILVSIDTAGASNGTLGIDGGTNATPSAVGLAAKASLEGKGWTVTTN
jgi:hypothetical protein